MKEEHRRDCTLCKEIQCLDLFSRSKDSQDAGNELYVYSILGRKVEEDEALGLHVCTNGRLLNAACFLTVPIYYNRKDSYLSEVLIQVTRDFKASMFLAFSGHYRGAMQVLRCAFENIISGVYFHSDLVNLKKKNASPEQLSRLNARFNTWKKDGRGDIRRTIEVLRRIDFLSWARATEYCRHSARRQSRSDSPSVMLSFFDVTKAYEFWYVTCEAAPLNHCHQLGV